MKGEITNMKPSPNGVTKWLSSFTGINKGRTVEIVLYSKTIVELRYHIDVVKTGDEYTCISGLSLGHFPD